MKKFALVLGVVAMVASSVMAAFAQESVEVNSVVTVDQAENKDGNHIDVRVDQLTDEDKAKVDEITKPENLKDLLGDKYSDDLKVIDALEVSIWEEGVGKLSHEDASKHTPIKVTFNVPGVTPDGEAYILQYYDGAWHVVEGLILGDGTVTGSFTRTGPVVFLAGSAVGGDVTVDGSTVTSPQTGEGSVATVVAMLAVAAFAGVVILRKKFA